MYKNIFTWWFSSIVFTICKWLGLAILKPPPPPPQQPHHHTPRQLQNQVWLFKSGSRRHKWTKIKPSIAFSPTKVSKTYIRRNIQWFCHNGFGIGITPGNFTSKLNLVFPDLFSKELMFTIRFSEKKITEPMEIQTVS